MKKITFLLCLCLGNSLGALNVQKAVVAYKNENYTEAVSLWERELKNPKSDKEQVFMHLGNAYAKNKNYAQALAYYEKSLRENYNQEDVRFNIKVIRAKLGLETDNKLLFTSHILRKICFLLSANALKIQIIILSLLLLFYTIYRYFRGDLRWGFLRHYGTALVLVFTAIYFLQIYFKSETGRAVVSIESVGYENMNLKGNSKTIREGEIVVLKDQIGDNIQVETESNKTLWIQKENVISI